MNERIKELAEQAGYKPLPGFDFANSLEETYLKKFAKLLIEECAHIANENVKLGSPYCGQFVRRHFGVES